MAGAADTAAMVVEAHKEARSTVWKNIFGFRKRKGGLQDLRVKSSGLPLLLYSLLFL
jgi:hypothetical protein